MTLKHPKTQARRAELLKIARQVFAEKGFDAATISEIVSRAGIAQGTFYLYFPSKISVVITLAEEIQVSIEQSLRTSYAESVSLDAMIEKSVESAFHIMGQFRDILALVHSGIRWPEFEEVRSRIFPPYHALLAEIIRQGQALGTVNSTINPEATAVFIVGLVYYAANQCDVYQGSLPSEVYITEAAHFIRQALRVQ
ncbi:MAG: TetR/AcrR family transcriptional regulator [Ktedonobacteraceae bacterium]